MEKVVELIIYQIVSADPVFCLRAELGVPPGPVCGVEPEEIHDIAVLPAHHLLQQQQRLLEVISQQNHVQLTRHVGQEIVYLRLESPFPVMELKVFELYDSQTCVSKMDRDEP